MRTVSAGEIPGAQEEFADDFPAGKPERFPEERDPLLFGGRRCALAPLRLWAFVARLRRCAMRLIQPFRKRSMALAKRKHRLRVRDRRLDLEPVPDDAGVGHQPFHVARAEARHDLGVESVIRFPECGALLQDGEPGEPGLVDLQDQPLEQLRVSGEREAVFGVVIRAVPLVAPRRLAVAAQGTRSRTASLPINRAGAKPSSAGCRYRPRSLPAFGSSGKKG